MEIHAVILQDRRGVYTIKASKNKEDLNKYAAGTLFKLELLEGLDELKTQDLLREAGEEFQDSLY